MNQTLDDHCCADFSADLIIPPKWRENVLSCRKCKRQLVCFLSEHFLQKIRPRLRHSQIFVTAGGLKGELRDKAVQVTSGQPPTINNILSCNADESDTRIWLHALHSPGTRKLVLSPDTDVYHIGLPVIAHTHLDVLVRLSNFSSIEQRFLDLQALLTSIKSDPGLAAVEQKKISPIFQTLFIATGCDYISFFNGIGKATFLGTLYEYSEFITADTTTAPGTLTNEPNGCFSFLRLVGCAYFKKHKSAFLPSFPTPMTLFNSVQPNSDHRRVHHLWLDQIRDRIWTRIQFEEDMVPSSDALLRHWKRTCWVSSTWAQATSNNMVHPPMEEFGWLKRDEHTLLIDWDSDVNMSQIRERVSLIRKGCSCKTGCSSGRCKCKKSATHCGPGCKCTGCKNLPVEALRPGQMDQSDSDTDSVSSEGSESELDEEVDKLMQDIFGDCNIDENTV